MNPLASNRTSEIASRRHTAIFLAIFLLLTLAGVLAHAGGAGGTGGAGERAGARMPALPVGRIGVYAAIVALEALLVAGALAGVRRKGVTLRELIGGRWERAADVVPDLAIAAAMWGTWTLFGRLWLEVLPASGGSAVSALLPRGLGESAVWVAVSAAAGFAEELAFRGYLQRQLTAITRHPWTAIVLQAMVFAVAHGYQGGSAMIRIGAYGVLFGMVARWRGSLRAGIMAHAWTDIAAGIFGI